MMCLISVVFPAPLAPTRPYTPPRGSDRVTDASAVFESKRRVRAVMSMTGPVSGVIASNGRVTILTRQQRVNNPALPHHPRPSTFAYRIGQVPPTDLYAATSAVAAAVRPKARWVSVSSHGGR